MSEIGEHRSNTTGVSVVLAIGLVTVAVLRATEQTTVAAALLGIVVAGAWLNFIRMVSGWRELRRQIVLESTALAFAITLVGVLTYTAVTGVLECACEIKPVVAEVGMIAALVVSAAVTWLRYR